ncbi:hypothetical protein B0H13DRAFT_1883210 [Mycena leptocephala]|nr:hypothetical protein B0H13DRAFT_1883210 [Mycena leptocephala]
MRYWQWTLGRAEYGHGEVLLPPKVLEYGETLSSAGKGCNRRAATIHDRCGSENFSGGMQNRDGRRRSLNEYSGHKDSFLGIGTEVGSKRTKGLTSSSSFIAARPLTSTHTPHEETLELAAERLGLLERRRPVRRDEGPDVTILLLLEDLGRHPIRGPDHRRALGLLVRQRRIQSPLRKRSVHDEDDGERRTYSSPPSPVLRVGSDFWLVPPSQNLDSFYHQLGPWRWVFGTPNVPRAILGSDRLHDLLFVRVTAGPTPVSSPSPHQRPSSFFSPSPSSSSPSRARPPHAAPRLLRLLVELRALSGGMAWGESMISKMDDKSRFTLPQPALHPAARKSVLARAAVFSLLKPP